jgi:hypothetical protein
MWGISWQNLNMYLASIPVYDFDKKDDAVNVVDGLDELKGLIDI